MPLPLEYSEFTPPSKENGANDSKTNPMGDQKPKSIFKRVGQWLRKNLFCCCSKPSVDESVPICDPEAEKKPALYKTEGGMMMWDPNSGTPCPHLLTTQNVRTGETTCCHCKEPVKPKAGEHRDGIHAMFN